MITVDLVMIDRILPDMTAWDLAGTLRSARPWQLWALVGSELSADDEVRARSLGATGVFDGRPTRPMLSEIAKSLRRRRIRPPKPVQAPAITLTTQ
jgi:DNA-binding response OmpR family regulator